MRHSVASMVGTAKRNGKNLIPECILAPIVSSQDHVVPPKRTWQLAGGAPNIDMVQK